MMRTYKSLSNKKKLEELFGKLEYYKTKDKKRKQELLMLYKHMFTAASYTPMVTYPSILLPNGTLTQTVATFTIALNTCASFISSTVVNMQVPYKITFQIASRTNPDTIDSLFFGMAIRDSSAPITGTGVSQSYGLPAGNGNSCMLMQNFNKTGSSPTNLYAAIANGSNDGVTGNINAYQSGSLYPQQNSSYFTIIETGDGKIYYNVYDPSIAGLNNFQLLQSTPTYLQGTNRTTALYMARGTPSNNYAVSGSVQINLTASPF